MAFDPNDIEIVLPQFHALDMFQKEGGAKSNVVVKDTIDVTGDNNQTSDWKLFNIQGRGVLTFTITNPSLAILIITIYDSDDNIVGLAQGTSSGGATPQTLELSNDYDLLGTLILAYTGLVAEGTLTYDLLGPDAVLLPGTVLGWDASPEETVRYQYRKIFIKNNSDINITNCLIYGIQNQDDQNYDKEHTNLMRCTEGTSTDWVTSDVTKLDIATLNADSPFGSDRVGFITKLTEDTINTTHFIRTSMTGLSNDWYSGFIYLKKGTATKVRIMLLMSGINGAYQDVDLANGILLGAGVVGGGNYDNMELENIGRGWFKLSFSFLTGGIHTGDFYIELLDSFGNDSYLGTSRYLYFANPYFEHVDYIGLDYIPSTTGPTTVGGVIKFALEKDVNQLPVLDGEEVIKSYSTAPAMTGPYDFIETVLVDNPQSPGNTGIIPSGSAQGIWIRQELYQEITCKLTKDFKSYFDLKMNYKDNLSVDHTLTFRIKHTRLNRTTHIYATRKDDYNPMSVIVDFEYTKPERYFVDKDNIIFGVYVDREFIKEIVGRSTKVQLENMNVGSILEIFAHPHSGFKFVRDRLVPGNKIKIVFRAKDPNKADVTKHNLYWDKGLGGSPTTKMGEVDAISGSGVGRYIKSASII